MCLSGACLSREIVGRIQYEPQLVFFGIISGITYRSVFEIVCQIVAKLHRLTLSYKYKDELLYVNKRNNSPFGMIQNLANHFL